MGYIINQAAIEKFQKKMQAEEKSKATIEKYVRDLKTFQEYVGENAVFSKATVIAYKQHLISKYAVASVNSMLAAVNSFFRENGWYDCIVKTIKVQRETFRSGEKELTREEYFSLLKAAKQQENHRLYMLMQTICSTGIRVSELKYITVEALHTRRSRVALKGKIRTVILPLELCRELKKYVRERNIKSGSIFVTGSGRPLDRSNIWHEMKKLCQEAGVDREKVFPHNLRHLFACTYYRLEKDITRLADILGHSNINTTRIYTMVSGKEQEEQIGKMGLVV